MRSGPTPAVVLEQTRMVMPSGLRSPPATGGLLPLNRKLDGKSETRRAAGRRPFTPSPAASGSPVEGGHDPRSGDRPLFHPVIVQRTGASHARAAVVSTRKMASSQRVGIQPTTKNRSWREKITGEIIPLFRAGTGSEGPERGNGGTCAGRRTTWARVDPAARQARIRRAMDFRSTESTCLFFRRPRRGAAEAPRLAKSAVLAAAARVAQGSVRSGRRAHDKSARRREGVPDDWSKLHLAS